MKTLASAFFCLCFLITSAALGQDTSWRWLPTQQPGPHEPDIEGIVVDGIATCGAKQSRARIAFFGARKSGMLDIGVWVRELSDVIPNEALYPYEGPDFGREAFNPHMIEITLTSQTGDVHFHSRMGILIGDSLPRGLSDDNGVVLATSFSSDRESKVLLHQLSEGFDHGTISIGRNVFSPSIEVKFVGQGIQNYLKRVLDFVGLANSNVNTLMH
jgi:hypothetical protein